MFNLLEHLSAQGCDVVNRNGLLVAYGVADRADNGFAGVDQPVEPARRDHHIRVEKANVRAPFLQRLSDPDIVAARKTEVLW